MKICNKCNINKSLDDFYNKKINIDGKDSRCKQCSFATVNKWRKNNPEKVKLYNKKNNFQYNYGISLEEVNEIFKSQNGCCAICKITLHEYLQNQKNNKQSCIFALDHNHKDSKIRGLLCKKCNMGLGLFKDNVNLLMEAINYLNIHNNKSINLENIIPFIKRG